MRKKAMLIAAVLVTVMIAVFVFAACDEEVTTYKLTLVNGDGTETQVTDILAVEKAPDAPVREGYRFEGWYLDPDYSVAPTYPLALTADVVFYAKWTQLFNVTYETNGGSEVEEVLTDVVETSPRTYRDGFVFEGWYTNPRLTGSKVQFPYIPTKDVTLYAKWSEDKGVAEYEQTTTYINALAAMNKIKGYFEAMSGTAFDFDTLLTTKNGIARVQLQANLAEGESIEFMFRVTMQEDGNTAFALYVVNGEAYLEIGNEEGSTLIHLEDFKTNYLYSVLQKALGDVDLEELLSNVGGFNIYDILIGLIFASPSYTSVTRVSTGEIVSENFIAEIKVNTLVSEIKDLVGMFSGSLGDLLGFDLNLDSLFGWLDSVIPQIKMYLHVDVEDSTITNLAISVADNAEGNEGDELLNWKSTKIGYYDYRIYIDMPTDLESNSKEFSFSNLAFDADLKIDAPEKGLDVAKLIGLFTDEVSLPENTLILQGEFGFRLSVRADIDLNYDKEAGDRNLIAVELYVLGADGEPTAQTPALGVYYKDGAFYVSLSDLIPDYWKTKNIRIEANLDAVINGIVDMITSAIDDALGTDFDAAKALSLSDGNAVEARMINDGGEVRAVISPTISGLVAAVTGVLGLQENVYVDAEGDSLVIEVNQKLFDVINNFLDETSKITLPTYLNNMSLSVNFAEYGLADVVATVDLGDADAPLGAEFRAHDFRVGFLEGTLEDLGGYIDERVQSGGEYTSNLGDMIYSVLAGAEINAHGKVSLDEGEYALGKVLAAFGLDTGGDNPTIGVTGNVTGEDGISRYELDAGLYAAFSLDKENPENSKVAVELKANDNLLLGLYGYYENAVSTVVLDLSGIKTEFLQLPIYKFEFDFANMILDLIDGIRIDGKSLSDFDLAFDLSGLLGGSAEAEALLMTESDGTAGGTELTEAGAILIGLNADAITANIAFSAVIALLESLNVDTGLIGNEIDLDANVSLSNHGVSVGAQGKLPLKGSEAYGNYSVILETGTSDYPITIGEAGGLEEAIARGKQAAEAAQDNLYDTVFDLANSMQASLSVNISNQKDNIDIAAMLNSLLAKEGSYIGFPISLSFDKSDSDVYLDLKWDIHLDSPYDTKIYLELRYEQKKILSVGIQNNDLYIDLSGLGLFSFVVDNSDLASSLFTMLDEQMGVLRDTDIGALLTELVTGASGASESGNADGSADSVGDPTAGEETDSAKAILTAILGDISIYDGVIKADISATTFDTIFNALIGATLGVKMEVKEGEIDVESGVIRLPISFNDTFNVNAELALRPSEEFTIVNESEKSVDASNGEKLTRSLLKCLDLDFNLDILNNNIESYPNNSYLRVRIKNVIEGENDFALDGTSEVAHAETLVVSVYMISSEDKFNNTTSDISGDALLHVTLDYSDDAINENGEGNNMKIAIVPNKFKLTVLGISIDLADVVGGMLSFQMDLVGMLSETMQSLIDSLVFTEDGVEYEAPEISVAESTEDTGEEESTPSPFDGLDVNELLSGGIEITMLSTGTLNIDASIDPYIFNKLIDDLMGGMLFGVNSVINLTELAPDMFPETGDYFKFINWDRINVDAFWSTFSNELKNIILEVIKNVEQVKSIIDVIGDGWIGIAEGPIEDFLDGVVYEIVKSLLPLPVYNEINAGVNLVDGTLTNIYIKGYDRNEAVTNADGEVLEYHGKYCVNNAQNVISNDKTYDGGMRRNTYKTEINLYNCFPSVGDPDNTVDGSGTAGVINWGDMEFDMTFDPLAYRNNVISSDSAFINEYFVGKTAVYQSGSTVIKSSVMYYMWDDVLGNYGAEITASSTLGLLDYANNENFETVTLKGKAVASFAGVGEFEREFTITIEPNLEPALVETVTLHAYDKAPSSIVVYFRNQSSRRVEMSAITSLEMPAPTIEGGVSEATVTFKNGMTATVSIEYLNSVITTLGSDGESGVYELDLYSFDETLDIMAQLPTMLFYSYEDGSYGAIEVEKWDVEQSVLDAFKEKQTGDLSGTEFTAVATVGKGDLVQTLEITVRIRNKEVTSLEIDGNENTLVINPYEYYLYAVAASEGSTFDPWPSEVKANYVYDGKEWSESVKVDFSTTFDFSSIRYDAPTSQTATVTLDSASYGDYFVWTRTIALDVQSNVIEGIYFDRSLRRNSLTIDALAFNAMTAEEKQAVFPSTAWVKFTNGYVTALPIRWTDRNGYVLDYSTLTFDANDYSVQVYAEIGFADDAAIEAAFYQRYAMTLNIDGALEYVGEGITVDPAGESLEAQMPSAITVGNGVTNTEVSVTWNLSGVDYAAEGEYLAAATFVYNGKTYSLIIPVRVAGAEAPVPDGGEA